MQKISIIIPVYNEEKTLRAILEKVKNSTVFDLEKEIILVDDGSTDRSKSIIDNLENTQNTCKIIHHPQNFGKGAAVRTGFAHATGDIILIQDADLELDPKDYPDLIKPILESQANIVYGSRYHKNAAFIYTSHYWGLKLITYITNKLYGANITDMYCGYKAYRAGVIKPTELVSNRFGIEAELTAQALMSGHKIANVPVSYYPRTFSEGKKLKWWDGLQALCIIFKYKFFS